MPVTSRRARNIDRLINTCDSLCPLVDKRAKSQAILMKYSHKASKQFSEFKQSSSNLVVGLFVWCFRGSSRFLIDVIMANSSIQCSHLIHDMVDRLMVNDR
jgi:hypothetical protein